MITKFRFHYFVSRSFQNVEETARDILVNELISPKTAAFKNVEIDATSIFIKSKIFTFLLKRRLTGDSIENLVWKK